VDDELADGVAGRGSAGLPPHIGFDSILSFG
jgi:hypothetical protein